MRNFGVDVVRCRRSVYCIGQTLEEFPVCQARVRVHGTFSEVCNETSSHSCVFTHCLPSLVTPGKITSKFYQVLGKELKGEWGRNIPPRQEGKLIYFKTTVNVLDFALPGYEYM